MEDKHKELISASRGLLQPITSSKQRSQVKKTNDVYTEPFSCLKTASLALFPYQSVQAGASRGGGPLLWAVRPEASVEHIRNTTSGPSHSCGFGLTAALKDLQLQQTRAAGRHGFQWFWVQKAEETCCFVKVI